MMGGRGEGRWEGDEARRKGGMEGGDGRRKGRIFLHKLIVDILQ